MWWWLHRYLIHNMQKRQRLVNLNRSTHVNRKRCNLVYPWTSNESKDCQTDSPPTIRCPHNTLARYLTYSKAIPLTRALHFILPNQRKKNVECKTRSFSHVALNSHLYGEIFTLRHNHNKLKGKERGENGDKIRSTSGMRGNQIVYMFTNTDHILIYKPKMKKNKKKYCWHCGWWVHKGSQNAYITRRTISVTTLTERQSSIYRRTFFSVCFYFVCGWPTLSTHRRNM